MLEFKMENGDETLVDSLIMVEEEQKRLIATAAGVCMAEKNGDAERNANDEKPPKMLHFTTTDEILSEIGLLNPHSIFITLSMAFLWCLSAMPTMSPAYMSPPTPCLQNCTFITVQDEFQLKRTIVDPAEMTSSVYFLGNLVLGQMYCMAADRLLPESFGFLITKRRATQAKKWIQRANRWGGSNFDCDVLKTIENETARVPEEKDLTETLYHVFHCPKLVLYMGIQTILWVVDFMVYNSLSLTATDDQIFNGLMFATFAALCAFCGFITTFLPETKTSH
ncbi:hypothetical protein TELCIR_13539 [Teladorsagia circumcincta]|uniref:Uncharacterized protein n=1 Tax=Teladorsagia circumcincta TaxID=45464 RepID=A0A2G9U3I9_TELCI|nr:hypothetical protein TELCIR_13539 [Teladorsagia circumcincta]